MSRLSTNKNICEVENNEAWCPSDNRNIDSVLQCKSCGEKADYTTESGRYGYYIRCNKCKTNTSMKIPCVRCGSKNTKVSKRRNQYSLVCKACDNSFVFNTAK